MSGKRCPVLFLFCFWLFPFFSAYPWEEVTLPNQTTKFKEEEVTVNNQGLKLIYCRSSLSQEEIWNFYLRFLPGLGWEGCPECSSQGKGSPLVFTKANDKIVITAMRDPLQKDSITLVITMSKVKDVAIPYLEKDEDSPGQDLSFIPRYPGSQKGAVVKRDSGQKVTLVYSATDPIDRILDFYKQNMAKQGWNLERSIDFQDLAQRAEFSSLPKEAKLKGGSLSFRSSYGQCIVTVSADPKQQGTNIIGINYNAK